MKRYHSSDDEVPRKVRKIDTRGSKRRFSTDDENDASKHLKIDKRGSKRRLSTDDESEPAKYRKIDKRGIKRSHMSNDEERMGKIRRIEPDSKRSDLIGKLKREISKWKRLYHNLHRKKKRLEDECKEKIELLENQLEDLKEFDGDYELNRFSDAVLNSVTIEEFNKIRDLIANNRLSQVLRSRKLLTALQKLFLGLSYGIIPITAPQRIALSEDEKKMVRTLENASTDEVKSHIQANQNSFMKLFSVLDLSIKLITQTYARYGTIKA